MPNRRLAALLAAAALTLATPADAARCRAVDGDTLACGTERVRLVGLDAPELRAQCPREWHAARASRARLQQLIAGGVQLERRGSDRYRRTLAIARTRDGRDVAMIMIREGHARAYSGRGRRGGWC